MSPERVLLGPGLSAWLVRADHEPVPDWEPDPPAATLQCDPALVARLAAVARPIGRPGRRFVDGCPVIHHPRGAPIATAAGADWIAVRSGLPAGALAVTRPPEPALAERGWVNLDPWGPDTAFARVIDLLRAHVSRAYELAEGELAEGELAEGDV
ncbi:MAG TPA: hypothetical protein VGP92_02450 [Acidimicrobiia bacterium]|nr:hypothetical protein [Acidimicrobiia bacterium]